jgi:hypothetical protein
MLLDDLDHPEHPQPPNYRKLGWYLGTMLTGSVLLHLLSVWLGFQSRLFHLVPTFVVLIAAPTVLGLFAEIIIRFRHLRQNTPPEYVFWFGWLENIFSLWLLITSFWMVSMLVIALFA